MVSVSLFLILVVVVVVEIDLRGCVWDFLNMCLFLVLMYVVNCL